MKPAGGGTFYAANTAQETERVWEEHWRERRQEKVQAQLRTLDAAVRESVERELRQNLLDLGIQLAGSH